MEEEEEERSWATPPRRATTRRASLWPPPGGHVGRDQVERDTHTYTDTDFRFCFCYASYPILVHTSRSLEGMIRVRCVIRDGLSVDRHLDRAFDSTRQSFSFSFARITIYIYTLLYIFVSPRIFFCLERREYCYFDLISRDLWDRNSWFSF